MELQGKENKGFSKDRMQVLGVSSVLGVGIISLFFVWMYNLTGIELTLPQLEYSILGFLGILLFLKGMWWLVKNKKRREKEAVVIKPTKLSSFQELKGTGLYNILESSHLIGPDVNKGGFIYAGDILLKYAEEKIAFLKIKNYLLELISKDESSREISPEEVVDISDSLTLFSSKLNILTDIILELMPEDIGETSDMNNPMMYIEMLLEENSWAEGEAKSMIAILSDWMKIHEKEVSEKKEELFGILEKQGLSPMANLIEVTGKTIQTSIERVRTHI